MRRYSTIWPYSSASWTTAPNAILIRAALLLYKGSCSTAFSVLIVAARDVEADGTEVEFVFRHGLGCFHHMPFVSADLEIYGGNNVRRRRRYGRRRCGGALSGHEGTRDKAKCRQQTEHSQMFH